MFIVHVLKRIQLIQSYFLQFRVQILHYLYSRFGAERYNVTSSSVCAPFSIFEKLNSPLSYGMVVSRGMFDMSVQILF